VNIKISKHQEINSNKRYKQGKSTTVYLTSINENLERGHILCRFYDMMMHPNETTG